MFKSGWRHLYSIVLCLLLPVVLMRLWWRGRANPDYRHRVSERLGVFRLPTNVARVWLHAVSVGEVNVAIPVIKALLRQNPEYRILVTTTTPTGAAQLQRALAEQIDHCYLPYDIPVFVKSALRKVAPAVLIVMETEIWPNLIHHAKSQGIPIVYLNMRLSKRSFPTYQKIRGLIAPQLVKVDAIAAQTQQDAQRVQALGAQQDRVQIFGNIKFDASLPEGVAERARQLRLQLGADRAVWICASTHPGEHEQLLHAFHAVLEYDANALLIIVPRHPEQFDKVYQLAQQQFRVCRRTEQIASVLDYQVYLGDTMGELLDLYAASDVCFVGGSLVAKGGQNVLEPWLLGKPVIVGPHTFNFARIIEQANQMNAVMQIQSSSQLAGAVIDLLESPDKATAMCYQAEQILAQNKGALNRSVELLQRYL